MAIREWFIEFLGDPFNDKENYKRYVSGTPFKPVGLGDEVIHVIDASGMPSKEEIRKALSAIKASNAITCAELIQWLESLAAD